MGYEKILIVHDDFIFSYTGMTIGILFIQKLLHIGGNNTVIRQRPLLDLSVPYTLLPVLSNPRMHYHRKHPVGSSHLHKAAGKKRNRSPP